MNKLFLSACFAAFASVSANAAVVTYTTVGSEICFSSIGCGSTSQNVGGASGITVSFSGASQTVNATTFASLGDIIISCTAGGTSCGSQALTNLILNIKITQTVPSAGSNNIVSQTITGSISGNSSGAQISWSSPNTVAIGNITYGVQNSPLALVPPSSLGGDTTIQGIITDRTVPEPSTYALLASGLVGLGLMRRRRS